MNLPERPTFRCEGCGEWVHESDLFDVGTGERDAHEVEVEVNGGLEPQPCGPVNAIPQQEPVEGEWTGDMIHRLEMDWWGLPQTRPRLWDYMAARINQASVQPRRVSREEFHAALSDAFGLSAEAEDTDRAGRRFMDRLGIEITPKERNDE